ncbi:MAG: TonB-dependent receptor [Rikenellaceae bacterium]
MKKLTLIYILFAFVAQFATAANNNEFFVRGHVIDANTQEHVPHATVLIVGTTIGTVADETGHFFLNGIPMGDHKLQVSMVGYAPENRNIKVDKNSDTLDLTFNLVEDVMSLDQVIVSASRTETTRRHSPTLVSVMPSDMFERVNAPTLADGLTFNTGIRVDNNCQNCGFTQVRINGLEGNYSQVLIDSRPIFSALTGVYGLESIPAAMVDRVEVVRGGGSALFGSSAIGGTINIITKTPEYSGAEISSTLTVLGDGGSTDSNTTANATYVTDNGKAGFTMFAQSRTRESYDANDDGFSEIPELSSKTIGLRTFFKTSDYSKLSFAYDATSDSRRGGDKLNEPIELSEVCESASHTINAASVNFDLFSRNRSRKLNIYSSMMNTARDTYYNAAGSTDDFTIATGAQFTSNFDRVLFMPSVFVAGFEHTYNKLYDQQYNYSLSSDSSVGDEFQFSDEDLYVDKSGYGTTEQKVNTYSLYAQNEWKNDKVGILIGARADYNTFIERVIVSPRFNFRYNPSDSFNFRATYASGFRSPQLFDEDLHIMIVQGEQSKIENDPNLKEEKSHSFSVSADTYKTFGRLSTNFLVEGFYTILNNAFTLSESEMSDGFILQTRTNSEGAKVYGASFEARAAIPRIVEFQAGFTVQRSKYDESEGRTQGETITEEGTFDSSADDFELEFADAADQNSILRSPNNYGYFSARFPLTNKLTLNSTATYTGKMLVEHVMGGEIEDANGSLVEYEYTEYIKSQNFFDMNLTLTYDFTIASAVRMSVTGGVQNIFDSYQSTFDTGADRDAGFVYGPMNPRRFTIGAKLMF